MVRIEIDVEKHGPIFNGQAAEEGVGSRNKTTRFKGYFVFRRISQRLDRQAKHIAERRTPPMGARPGSGPCDG